MAAYKPNDRVVYQCKKCGKKTCGLVSSGYPVVGNCKDGKPHSWTIIKKY